MSGVKAAVVRPFEKFKIRIDCLLFDFREDIKKLKREERIFSEEYCIELKQSQGLENLMLELMAEYDDEPPIIELREEHDRERFRKKYIEIQKEFALIKIEVESLENEIKLHLELIANLEAIEGLEDEIKELNALCQNRSSLHGIEEKSSFLQSIKEALHAYETQKWKLFIKENASQLEEDILIEHSKEELLRREIKLLQMNLEFLKPKYRFPFDLEKEDNRLALIKDELKVQYAKAVKAKILENELLDLKDKLSSRRLNEKISLFIENAEDKRESFLELKQEIDAYKKKERLRQENKSFASNMIKSLTALGYEIVDEEKERFVGNEEIYITIEKEYKLKVIFQEDNSYRIRFVKEVSSLSPPSTNEKLRDMEIMQKWYGDYARLLTLLADNGLTVEHKMILEPDTDDIEYELKAEIGVSSQTQKEFKGIAKR